MQRSNPIQFEVIGDSNARRLSIAPYIALGGLNLEHFCQTAKAFPIREQIGMAVTIATFSCDCDNLIVAHDQPDYRDRIEKFTTLYLNAVFRLASLTKHVVIILPLVNDYRYHEERLDHIHNKLMRALADRTNITPISILNDYVARDIMVRNKADSIHVCIELANILRNRIWDITHTPRMLNHIERNSFLFDNTALRKQKKRIVSLSHSAQRKLSKSPFREILHRSICDNMKYIQYGPRDFFYAKDLAQWIWCLQKMSVSPENGGIPTNRYYQGLVPSRTQYIPLPVKIRHKNREE